MAQFPACGENGRRERLDGLKRRGRFPAYPASAFDIRPFFGACCGGEKVPGGATGGAHGPRNEPSLFFCLFFKALQTVCSFASPTDKVVAVMTPKQTAASSVARQDPLGGFASSLAKRPLAKPDRSLAEPASPLEPGDSLVGWCSHRGGSLSVDARGSKYAGCVNRAGFAGGRFV